MRCHGGCAVWGTMCCSRCRGRCSDFLLAGVPSWHFRGSSSHVSMGRQKLPSKEVPGDSFQEDGDCSVPAFPWVFPLPSVTYRAGMELKPGLWSVCVGELLVEGLCVWATPHKISFSLRYKVNIHVFSVLPKNSLATHFELFFVYINVCL